MLSPPRTFIAAALHACALILSFRAVAGDAEKPFRIDYTVDVASIEDHTFHVSADVQNIREDSVEFELPVWTPGWYVIEDYARNISRFIVRGQGGERLNHARTGKQSWRVNTHNRDHISIEFDYNAAQLSLNQAKVDTNIAFFTGTQLFLMARGHRASASSMRLKCPDGWRALSSLKETGDPFVFSAANYDELVDCPVLLGEFDVSTFEALGKVHAFASVPKGAINAPRAREITAGFKKLVETTGAMFGGLPYEKYVYFYFFRRPETRAAGGLEHANSHVCFFPHGAGTSQGALEWMAAHEFFHVWNIKRIRPAELWPYDYAREVDTPLLWVSEGFTTYYGSVMLYRAGLASRAEFYDAAAGTIAQVESTPARDFISPAEASTSTWLGYDRHMPFEISYYLTGRNLAMLLDISILHDTSGERGLDDVMRALYANCYLKNKGFSSADLQAEIQTVSGHDYAPFFSRYVDGIEHMPYAQIMAFAGMTCDISKRPNAAGSFNVRLVEMPNPSDAQKKVRDAWMKK